MKYFNSSKIIQEAESVIASIELKLLKQKNQQHKQDKVDKLNSLVHYTCYLEKQNNEFFDKFIMQMEKIKMLENHVDNLQNKLNVDNQLKNF